MTIAYIVGIRTEEKMCRVAARRVIAAMEDV
jgi:hypothetical protein